MTSTPRSMHSRRGRVATVTVVEASADGEDPLTVLNAVSVGTYPAFIEKRERRERLGKWLGGLVATGSELREAEPITIARDGRRAPVWSVFIGVGRNDPELVATVQRQTWMTACSTSASTTRAGRACRRLASLAFGKRTAAVLRALRLFPRDADIERLVVHAIQLRGARRCRGGRRCSCTMASSRSAIRRASRCAAWRSPRRCGSTPRAPSSPVADEPSSLPGESRAADDTTRADSRQSCWGKPRFRPPCEGSSQRDVIAFSAVKKSNPCGP